MSRHSKIKTYLTEYHAGFLAYGNRSDASVKVDLAQSVIGYHSTDFYAAMAPSTVRAYVTEIERMLEAGELKLESGTFTLLE